ncbi:MAG TPA: hypothetical protein VF735_03520 [Pyrinomonadaceae bacterium]|jgi:hypothetical protein
MTNAKKILLLGCGGLVVCGFLSFVVLVAVLWQVADDAEDAKKSKVTIVVQHKLYDDGTLPLGHQCISHIVLIRDHGWEVSPDGKEARDGDKTYRAVDNNRTVPNFDGYDWPQPFGGIPAVSKPIEHEFKVEAPKTYYYLVEVSGHECPDWKPAPADAIGFKTGQFSIAANESKRIEVNFTNR